MILDCGLKEAGTVLAAVSGGADSLALLHALRGAGYPLLVAHFNHRLRPEADSDAAFVRRVAEGLGLPFVTDSADVAAYAAEGGLSIEEAARELRYQFLFREARRVGAQAVATGHTADDQAETVLMHFLRGAGLSGLKGMPPRVFLPVFDAEIPLVRPLLGWTRAQTEAFCRENGQDFLTDLSNADTAYFRNKLRHELLPLLETYNPQIRQSLEKTARALQGDHELLSEAVEAAWLKTATPGAGFVAFDLPGLQALSVPLRRNLFRRAAFALKPGLRDVDFEALERVASLRPLDLAGGLRTVVEGGRLYLFEDEKHLPGEWPQVSGQYSVFSEVTGGVEIIELGDGWTLTCEHWQPATGHSSLATANWPDDPFTATLDADLTAGRLRLRPFRAGDRFEPLGMLGQTVKLSDLFTNLKIPRRFRENWPVLCVDDEIAWVAGLRMSERFKVTPQTRRVLRLRLACNA
jgi:tRNA(Ile)-lysidine synthase